MAINLDSSDAGGSQSVASTTLTVAHTCTGANVVLDVDVGNGSHAADPTGLTYNGVSMSKLGTNFLASVGGITKWALAVGNADGASHNIVATWADSQSLGYLQGKSYTGCRQSGIPDASTTNSASAADHMTTSLTTVADKCWVTLGYADSVSGSGYTYTGLTERSADVAADTNGIVSPAGSFTGTVTNTGNSQDWIGIMVSYAPASCDGLALMGCGA